MLRQGAVPGPRTGDRAMGRGVCDRDRTTTRRGRRSIPSTSPPPWRGPGWNCNWRCRAGRGAVERGLIDALAASVSSPTTPRDAAAMAAGHAAYADAMAALAVSFIPTTSTSRHWPPTHWSTSPHGRCGTPAPVNPHRVPEWSRRKGSGSRRWQRMRGGRIPVCCTSTCTPWRCRPTPNRRASRSGSAAWAGARRRAPAAHAHPHRRAVR